MEKFKKRKAPRYEDKPFRIEKGGPIKIQHQYGVWLLTERRAQLMRGKG